MPQKSKQAGFAVVALVAAVALASWLAVHLSGLNVVSRSKFTAMDNISATMTQTDIQQELYRAAAIVQREATIAADGYPLAHPPVKLDWAPEGGGILPANTKAPRMAGGRRLGYCAWDNGPVTNNAAYLPGVNSPAATVFALIYPSRNNGFNTSCEQALANNPQGGDLVVLVSTTQIVPRSELP